MEAAGARLDTMKPMLEDNKAFVSESNVAGEGELGGWAATAATEENGLHRLQHFNNGGNQSIHSVLAVGSCADHDVHCRDEKTAKTKESCANEVSKLWAS